MDKLEKEFEQELWEIDEVASKQGYHATLFRQMLAEHGGLKTAQKLLAANAPQYGLLRLRELGLLQNSLENTVLNPKYRDLFLTREIDTARERLLEFGFQPGGWEQE